MPPETPIPSETPAPSPAASPGCDEIDQLFARMFAGLTDAALANAGVDRDAFLAAMAGDRATARRYLASLGTCRSSSARVARRA